MLSRIWYGVLAIALGATLVVAYEGVSEYNRQATRGIAEGLASDSQRVEWWLERDARRRLDALVGGSVDPTLQQALAGANAPKDGRPLLKWRLLARKALAAISDGIPADARNDALFAVDRDGHALAEVGYEAVAGNEDFELGGYPAVDDALHGWARDDVWVVGGKMYLVVARPVPDDGAQSPAGALVALREVTPQFADDLAKRSGTNLVFYASTDGVAGGTGVAGFQRERLKSVGSDLKNVVDQMPPDRARSDVRMLSDDLGAVYTRLPGDSWLLDGGFAVVRETIPLSGLLAVLSHAADADRANVPWALVAVLAALGAFGGIVFTMLERTAPLAELVRQSEQLKAGKLERLDLTRIGVALRVLAQNINQGLEHVAAKAAEAAASKATPRAQKGDPGPPRSAKPPRAQLPRLGSADPAASPSHAASPGAPSAPSEPQIAPGAKAAPSAATPAPAALRLVASPPQAAPVAPNAVPSVMKTAPSAAAPSRPQAGSSDDGVALEDDSIDLPTTTMPTTIGGPSLAATPAGAAPRAKDRASLTMNAAPSAQLIADSLGPPAGPGDTVRPPSAKARPMPAARAPTAATQTPEATAIRSAPAEILSLATGESRVPDTTAVVPAPVELLAEPTLENQSEKSAQLREIYETFLRVRVQCGEPTEPLTFERFSAALEKHRDALVASTHCKEVKFAVNVKNGKAALTATPLQG